MFERKEYLDYLIKLKDKNIIKIVTGVRRCGKSTLFILFKKYLRENKISEEQIIHFNFDDPKDNIFKTWQELYNYVDSKLVKEKMNYIFLDEIQTIKDFEKAVAGLFIKENVDLCISSSNSCLLSGEFVTYLTGRYMQIHMLPLSFKEYIEYYGDDNIAKKYNLYIQNGGFPYLLNINITQEMEKNSLLDVIYNGAILKEIISKNNINNLTVLNSIIRFIFSNIGQLVSNNKIINTLQADKYKCSINTVESYLRNILDSYLVYKVSRYDIKRKRYLKTGNKYYVCDLGLRKYLIGNLDDSESILENVVFLELKRRNYEIYIGKYNDMEIDFIVKNETGIKYIQVSLSVRDEKTLKQVLRPLQSISDNYPKYIITLDYDSVDYDGIKQINAIDFLLGRTDI